MLLESVKFSEISQVANLLLINNKNGCWLLVVGCIVEE